MKEFIIRETTKALPRGRSICYRLKLSDGEPRTRYDLELTVTDGTTQEDTCLLPDAAYTCDDALRLFSLFVQQTVTPCTALEIYDELQEQETPDFSPFI